jgi:hypothetical protein
MAAIVALVNALVRVFGLFKKKGGASRGSTRETTRETGRETTTTTRTSERNAPVGSAPPKIKMPPGATRESGATRDAGATKTKPPTLDEPVGSDGGIGKLFKQQKGDVVVQASGEIVHILPDDDYDLDGSGQHQNFLVELMGGLTIKIAHNLKFDRVPAKKGDFISFKGEYEYNEKGGCVHWTHHDPKGWHEDGWIEHNGTRYG